jgi:hypothetical protein
MAETRRAEKRQHPRVETHLPVRYRKLDEPWSSTKTGTITRNLSKGGLRFRTKEFVSSSCRMVMELDISAPRAVKAISMVSWIKKCSHGEEFDVGSHFLEMTDTDRKTLFSYMDTAVNK